MNITLPFYLQRACMVEVVKQLFQCDIPNYLERCEYDDWITKEVKVIKSKIQKLKIPTVLKEALNSMVNPICKYYQNAMDTFYYECTPYIPICSIHKCIRMTSWGTVDMKRSAEALLDLSVEELPKLMRYEVARFFCLQDRFTSCYEDLDEADRMRLPSSLDHVDEADGEAPRFSNFEYAVLNGNEVAARHFWNTEENLPPSTEFITQILIQEERNIHSRNLPDLFLFLFSCYPDNELLRELQLDSEIFLVSLFEWPYQDKLLEFFYSMPEQQRYTNMWYLMFDIFYNFHKRQLDGDYLDTIRQFLKEVLAKDKGLTSPNPQANYLLIPYWGGYDISEIRASDRIDWYCDGWKTPWQTIALSTIDFVLFQCLNFDENEFLFVRVLLEFLEQNDKVQHCELRANDVDAIIHRLRLHQLDWLFEECLTHEQSTAIRNRLWANKNNRTVYRYVRTGYVYRGHCPDAKDRLNEVMKFYRISRDKVKEMVSQFKQYPKTSL